MLQSLEPAFHDQIQATLERLRREKGEGRTHSQLKDKYSSAPLRFRCPSFVHAIEHRGETAQLGDFANASSQYFRLQTKAGRPSETRIAFVELSRDLPHWLDPGEVDRKSFLNELKQPAAYSRNHLDGANIASADGAVRFVSQDADPEAVRSALLGEIEPALNAASSN